MTENIELRKAYVNGWMDCFHMTQSKVFEILNTSARLEVLDKAMAVAQRDAIEMYPEVR